MSDSKAEWLRRVLGVRIEDAAEDTGAAVLGERLATVKADVAGLGNDAKSAVSTLLLDAEAMLADGNVAGAERALDAAETGVAEAVRAARNRTVATEAGHRVEFAKLLLQWRAAQDAVAGNLMRVGASLLAHPEIRADPRFDQIERSVAMLPTIVPKFGGALEAVLDAGLSAVADADVARLAAEGVRAIEDYRKQLAQAEPLVQVEAFSASNLGAGLALHSALDGALADLARQLAA